MFFSLIYIARSILHVYLLSIAAYKITPKFSSFKQRTFINLWCLWIRNPSMADWLFLVKKPYKTKIKVSARAGLNSKLSQGLLAGLHSSWVFAVKASVYCFWLIESHLQFLSMWVSSYGSLKHGSLSSKPYSEKTQRKSVSKMEVRVFQHLISYHHFCCILFIRS